MSSDAEDRDAGMRDAPAAAVEPPRFDLRFVAGRAMLRLARPLVSHPARIEELELAVSRVKFPFDVTRGVARFRTQRTRVARAAIQIHFADLARALPGLRVEQAAGDRLTASIRDQLGAVAFEARLGFDGADLLVAVSDVRAAVEALAPPLARLLSYARARGATVDAARGALRIARPLRWLLADPLIAHGFRAPDERSARVRIARLDAASVRIVLEPPSKGDAAPSLVSDLDRGATARGALLASLASLGAGGETRIEGADRDTTRAHIALAIERALEPERAEALLAKLPRVGDDDPLYLSLALRIAVRCRDSVAAARTAARLAREELSDEVAAEALLVAAELASETDRSLAYELAVRAMQRLPSSNEVALRCLAYAEHARTDDMIERIAQRAAAGDRSDEARARVLTAVARALLGMLDDATREAARERLSRAAAHLDSALLARPEDPEALRLLGEVCARRGDVASAVERFDASARGFEALGMLNEAAVAHARAAEVLRTAARHDGARHRYELASALVPDEPRYLVGVARSLRALGQRTQAAVAYEELLRVRTPDIGPMLAEAARFELEEHQGERGARPYVEALYRLRGMALDDAGKDLAAIVRRAIETEVAREDSRERRAGEATKTRVDLRSPAVRAKELEREHQERPSEESVDVPRGDVLAGLEALVTGPISPEDIARLARQASANAGLLATVADRLAAANKLPTQPAVLATLEEACTTDAGRAVYAEALARALRAIGDQPGHARALARAGSLRRDMATLRAAIDAAERTGNADLQVRVLDVALDVVGTGPARDALIEKRRALAAANDPEED